MKKTLFTYSVAFMGFAFLFAFLNSSLGYAQRKPAQYAEREVQTKKEKKTKAPFSCGYEQAIRVAGFVTNPPFGWVDVFPSPVGSEQDLYLNDGYAYHLFEKMTKDMGLKIKNMGFLSYHDALRALKKGDVDVLTGAYYDSRTLGVGTKILYPSYFSNPFTVFFKKGNEKRINSFADFAGLKGAVRQEELIYSLIWRNLPKGTDLKQVTGARKAFTMLMNGEIDFLLSSAYAGEAEIRRFKLMDDVTMSQVVLTAPELFYLFSTNSNCVKLMPKYEEQLKKEKENPNTIQKGIIDYIDTWGGRFADMPPLTEELKEKK